VVAAACSAAVAVEVAVAERQEELDEAQAAVEPRKIAIPRSQADAGERTDPTLVSGEGGAGRDGGGWGEEQLSSRLLRCSYHHYCPH